MTKWTERVWLYWVAGGVLATGLYFLLPRGSVVQMAVFLGVNGIAGVAVVAGVRIHRPERRTVWYLLFAFELFYLAASIPWYLALIGKTAPLPYPSYVDALLNLAYLTMVVAIVRLLRDRSTGRDRAGFVDAGIVTIGLGVLFYVFLLEPSIESGGITLGQQLVSASYPLIDVLLLGLLAKLIFSPARRVPALWLLTDGLTGVATRRRSVDVMTTLSRLTDRYGQPLSVILLDLDHFKSINDRHGHDAGDEVLRRLGSLLLTSFRGEDVVARWGGEEFFVGTYAMSKRDALRRMQNLLTSFAQERFLGSHGEFSASFSAGVAEYPQDGTDLRSLYRFADAALYSAKLGGRGLVAASDFGTGAVKPGLALVHAGARTEQEGSERRNTASGLP